MTWTCPHQTSDSRCKLRKKKCKAGSDGCVLTNQFQFVKTSKNADASQDDKKAK